MSCQGDVLVAEKLMHVDMYACDSVHATLRRQGDMLVAEKLGHDFMHVMACVPRYGRQGDMLVAEKLDQLKCI